MQTENVTDALLHVSLKLAASPGIAIAGGANVQHIPTAENTPSDSFLFELSARTPYGALGRVATALLAGKRLTLTEGLLYQYVVLERFDIAEKSGRLQITIPFSGSYHGTIQLVGDAFYDSAAQQLGLNNLSYDIDTKSLLLKGVKWMFGKLILDEIKKVAAVDVSKLYWAVQKKLDALLNQQQSQFTISGAAEKLTITAIQVLPHQIEITGTGNGRIAIQLSTSLLNF